MNTTEKKELDQILDSKEFNEMFDFESEQKELKKSGWSYKEVRSLANKIAKDKR